MDLFEAGEIVKTRGLHGCLKVLSCLEAAGNFLKPDFVYIEKFRDKKIVFVSKNRKIRTDIFIELDEIKNVDSARNLIGGKVLFSKDILKKLSAGEYYCHDIIGLDVYSENGDYIGKIETIFPTGSNDVYVCRNGKKKYFYQRSLML